jgi:hypothetical protein
MNMCGYIQTHCQKNKKIKQADKILPEVHGTTLRQVVSIYRINWYEKYCEGELKLSSHNTSYCLIDVVTNVCWLYSTKTE